MKWGSLWGWLASWSHSLAHLLQLNYHTIHLKVGRTADGTSIVKVYSRCEGCGQVCGHERWIEERIRRRHLASRRNR